MQNAIAASQAEAIKRLIIRKGDLLPVIGAGLSTPLGAPSWQSLKTKLASRILPEQDIAAFVNESAPEVLRRIKNKDIASYKMLMQSELLGLEGCTTVTMAAVAKLPVKIFATTNLDNHFEYALGSVGKTLLPDRSGTSEDIPRLRSMEANEKKPILIKLHGSLGRPETWIMTIDEYLSAYSKNSHIAAFLSSGRFVPLFIGYSMEDYEIKKSIFELASNSGEAFSFVKVSESADEPNVTRISGLGIRVIPVTSFDQISEILWQVAGMPHDRAFISENRASGGQKQIYINIGAAKNILYTEIDPGLQKNLTLCVENILDNSPNRDFITGSTARSTDKKGAYQDILAPLIAKKKNEAGQKFLSAFTKLIAFYPDVVVQRLIPDIMAFAQGGNSNILWDTLNSIEGIYGEMVKGGLIPQGSVEVIERKIFDTMLSAFESDDFRNFDFKTRKTIIKYAARYRENPYLSIPPKVSRSRIGKKDYMIMTYLMSRAQVAKLAEDILLRVDISDLEKKNPSRPFTPIELSQVASIVHLLSSIDREKKWTLLTSDEWIELAFDGGKRRWPWGDASPMKGVHSNLNFGSSGGESDGPSEIGLYPAGVSADGIADLFGNVYDLTFASPDKRDEFHNHVNAGNYKYIDDSYFRLCGGAWYFGPARVLHYPVKRYRSSGNGRQNIGLRLAYFD